MKMKIEPLPLTWFDRPPYSPRLEEEGVEKWFVLSGAVRRLSGIAEVPARAPQHASTPEARIRLREAIAATYHDWGLPRPPAVEARLDALLAPECLVAVTGQQPGFLTGPLYTVYKALSALAMASHVERARSSPCVPVFWVAAEDHDLEEVREARFPAPDGERSFRLPHRDERRPFSSYEVDAATSSILDEARAFFASRRHGDLAASLTDLYRGRHLASGFAAVLAELFGGRGLLVLDPARLRPLAAPIFRRLIEEPEAALEAVAAGARLLESRGLRPFVAPRLPLFILRDGRRDHLSPAPGGLAVDGGGPLLERRELLETLEAAPERFSSGALLRPAIQEALLPTALSVGGAAEIGYHVQLGPLCRWLGVPEPRIALRFQATLLEGKQARAWNRLGSTPARFATARSAGELIGLDLVSTAPALEELRSHVEETRRLLGRLPADFPAARRRPLERGAASALASLESLVRRAEKAQRQGSAELSGAAETLWRAVFPAGVLQERRWGVFHYLAKYGTGWLDELLGAIEAAPFEVAHRLVFF
jgi:bacillithiol biosynthesis cysteine-adding enzyme BshC